MVKNLKNLRIAHGVSQQALADVIGVSQQSVNKYENHEVEPDIETLVRLADYFDTTVDYLVGRCDAKSDIKTAALSLSANEERLLKLYRRLTKPEKDSIKAVMNIYAAKR